MSSRREAVVTVGLPAACRRHRALLAVIVVAFGLCLLGITAATTHPDQMALRPLFREGLAPFNPGWFEKPPFHTYTNYFLTVLPASWVAAVTRLSPDSTRSLILVWSRLVSTALLLAGVGVFYGCIRRSFGAYSAILLTVVLATSAGLIAHVHFLTADIPVTAWMLVAFAFSHRVLERGRTADYAWAGLLTGVATATKYNGLAIGIALAAAHYLRVYYLESRGIRAVEVLVPPKLVLGVACVGAGFVLANPFSVLDYRTFYYDFLHNYKVAPVYDGQTGSSWGRFFAAVAEVVGLPGALLLGAGWLASVAALARRDGRRVQRAATVLALTVVVVYYVKFAPFPRLETRFVLPIVPFVAIVPALALQHVRAHLRRYGVTLVLAIAGYNIACAGVVGQRFNGDPRLKAAAWLHENIPAHRVVEADVYSPDWRPRHGGPVEIVMMPFVTGRERLFRQLFKGDRMVVGDPEYYRQVDEQVGWYSAEALVRRNPDYLVVDSLYYARFTEAGPRQRLYPSMGRYFSDLLAQRLGYRIVFDSTSADVPRWAYPRALDFRDHRVTVLERRPL